MFPQDLTPTGRCVIPVKIICENPACQKIFYRKLSKQARFCSRPCWYAFYSNRTPEERFWAFVDIGQDQDSCWLWQGGTDNHGYGHFTITSKPMTQMSAHRYSYLLAYDVIPHGLFVCHNCPGPGGDNPFCIRPTHLFLGTQLDNIRDAWHKGRMPERNNHGDKNPHARITTEQAYEIRALQGIMSPAEVSKQYPITRGAINKIWTRKSWGHLQEL